MPKTTGRKRPRRGNGEGSIYREGDGYRAALTMPDGTVLRSRARTEKDAKAKLRKARREVDAGLRGSAGTVAEYLAWWLDVQEAKVGTGAGDLSVNTWINYEWALGPVIAGIGGRRLVDLEPEHVEAVLSRMARDGKARRSVQRTRAVLGQALDTAMRRGKVARNVARLAEMPRTAPPPEKRALTAEQARRLLEAAKGDPGEAVVVVGLMLGLRPGELLGLQWENVDFRTGHVTIAGSLKREGSTLRLGDVKRGIRQSRRRLTMPEPVTEALRAHRARQREQRMLAGPEWQDHGLVFATAVGTPISPSNMNLRLAAITERAGIGHWSMTELARHSAASLMSAAGVPLEVIADILGHTSTRMLEQHYRHQVRPSIDAHVAVMNDLFGAGAGGR